MILLERDLEKGYNAEAMTTLMDLLVHYPEELPDQRVNSTISWETENRGNRLAGGFKNGIVGALFREV